jgi:heptaprenylglyceryl phosphate synthase
VKAVREVYEGVLIVGGGITSPEVAAELVRSGAEIIVIGTLIESKEGRVILKDIVKTIEQAARRM